MAHKAKQVQEIGHALRDEARLQGTAELIVEHGNHDRAVEREPADPERQRPEGQQAEQVVQIAMRTLATRSTEISIKRFGSSYLPEDFSIQQSAVLPILEPGSVSRKRLDRGPHDHVPTRLASPAALASSALSLLLAPVLAGCSSDRMVRPQPDTTNVVQRPTYEVEGKKTLYLGGYAGEPTIPRPFPVDERAGPMQGRQRPSQLRRGRLARRDPSPRRALNCDRRLGSITRPVLQSQGSGSGWMRLGGDAGTSLSAGMCLSSTALHLRRKRDQAA